jgi:hypothetical protein
MWRDTILDEISNSYRLLRSLSKIRGCMREALAMSHLPEHLPKEAGKTGKEWRVRQSAQPAHNEGMAELDFICLMLKAGTWLRPGSLPLRYNTVVVHLGTQREVGPT